MQSHSEVQVARGHLFSVLLANAVLWAAVVLLTRDVRLGGMGVVAVISIASLVLRRPR